jgi:ethanolamine utilization protein EutN
MLIGTITGNVVSTKKNNKLTGCKFMRVKINETQEIVALDNIGAGIGEQVIVTTGHNAVLGLSDQNVPIDAVIVGIVD